MDGKAMIVCMSRRICVDLYRELDRAAPGWHDEDDDKGALKVVMTGSAADPPTGSRTSATSAARGAGEAVSRIRDDPFKHRHRARHVADRLRRAVPAHDVRRQADARPRADAGHRPRQPRLQGQARRPGRRLPRPCRRAEAGARDLHRERRQGRDRDRPGRSRRRDAGEVRGLSRLVPRLRLVSPWMPGDGAAADFDAARGAGAHSRAGTTARSGCCKP